MAEYTIKHWALDKALEAHRQPVPDKVDAAAIVATAETFLKFAGETQKA